MNTTILSWRAALIIAAAFPTATASTPCCGNARTSVNQPRIVGGSTAPQGAYPWMTALVERGQSPRSGQFCAGALIAPQWVLTAAHCVDDTSAGRLDVIVGAYDLRTSNGGGQRIQVTQIISHPSFRDVNDTLYNDVALLKLATPAVNLASIPLVDSAERIADGVACRSMGFGDTSEGGDSSPILLHVDMIVIGLATANRVYGDLTSVHIAAGLPSGGRDTCQGDSGGPLVVANPAGGWMHAGIVSFGDGCGRPGVPGINANTLTFASWIRQQIGAGTPPPTDDYGNTIATAASATPSVAIAGNLETAGDIDVFKVTVTSAGTLSAFSTGATALNGRLLNASGTVLAIQTGAPNFSLSSAVITAGTYYLAVAGAANSTTGPYGANIGFIATPVTGEPEMDLLGKDNSVILDNTTSTTLANGTSFGSVSVGASAGNVFTVRNSGTAALSVGSVQLSGVGAPMFRVSVAPASSVSAARTATFTISYAPTAVGNHIADVIIPNNDANENPYNFRLTGTATSPMTGAPEMELLGKDNSVIVDNTTTTTLANGTSFGSASVGASAANVFTVRNIGTAALSVGSVQLSGAGAPMFRVTLAPASSVNAAQSTAFTITYAPTAVGNHIADVIIANNDANENPYNFRLTGTATTTAASDDHGDTLAVATSVTLPLNRACILERSGDVDVFKFTVTSSTSLTLTSTGSIDTYATIYSATGQEIAKDDDSGSGRNFRIRRSFSPGTYYLSVRGYNSAVTGSYSVQVSN